MAGARGARVVQRALRQLCRAAQFRPQRNPVPQPLGADAGCRRARDAGTAGGDARGGRARRRRRPGCS